MSRGSHGTQHVVDPDIFSDDGAGTDRFGDQATAEVVDVGRGAGRDHVLDGPASKTLQAAIDVAASNGRSDRELIQTAKPFTNTCSSRS